MEKVEIDFTEWVDQVVYKDGQLKVIVDKEDLVEIVEMFERLKDE